jgi:small-conductance mechanosensitive channel
VDLKEKRQLDVAEHVAKVKARARPWRSIIALIIAIAAIVAVKWQGVPLHSAPGICTPNQLIASLQTCSQGFHPGKLITIVGAAVLVLCGFAAVLGLSGKARSVLQPAIGSAHASVVAYTLILAGAIAILLTVLSLLNISVGQLIVGGALTGVLIGIAAQQALGNVFAGMVLMFARPFSVGDRVWIRSGALSGTLEGTVVDISITYVRLETSDGRLFLPNSQVLAAVVGPAREPADQPVSPAAWQPGNPVMIPHGATSADPLGTAPHGATSADAPGSQVTAQQDTPAAGQPGDPESGQPGGPGPGQAGSGL